MSVLILSPHRDDAAFSCGLLIHALISAHVSVRIANVCTISDYAPYADLAAATNPVEEATRLRAREDDVFADKLRLGSSVESNNLQLLDLGWKDAPLRHAIQAADVLAGDPLSAEETSLLADDFRSLDAAPVVLVPLALGNHMDHRLVREAAVLAFSRNALVFYEDLPYACRMLSEQRLEETLQALPWMCTSAQTPHMTSRLKREAALCYRSQIAASVAEEMENYAGAMGWTEQIFGTRVSLDALASLVRVARVAEVMPI